MQRGRSRDHRRHGGLSEGAGRAVRCRGQLWRCLLWWAGVRRLHARGQTVRVYGVPRWCVYPRLRVGVVGVSVQVCVCLCVCVSPPRRSNKVGLVR